MSILNIHPTLVQKEDFKAEIQAYMTKWSAPESEDATQWLGEHYPEYHVGQPALIPEFQLVTASLKWGEEPDRVNTTALKILCAKKDGMYVKTLFTRTYKCKDFPHKLFLPA
eukprot:14083632-Ditylum_brightwellii.AAC.1